MQYPSTPCSSLEQVTNKVDQIVAHLRCWPCDLADVCYLMRLFRASAGDFQQALAQLEETVDSPVSARSTYLIDRR
ncbi:MAG: hypothetical protein AB7G75_19710 [Candidatus Binatia bacterium]